MNSTIKTGKDPATYLIRVREPLGKHLKRIADQRDLSIGDLLEILLANTARK